MLRDLAHCPSLSHVASACGLSNRQFFRAFKASNGLSPHRWLLGARIDRARELLEKSAVSIAEIADACGFADQSHLTRVFRKLVGAAPGAWRRARACCAGLEPTGPVVDGWAQLEPERTDRPLNRAASVQKELRPTTALGVLPPPGTGDGGAGIHWNGQIWRWLATDFKLRSHNEASYGKAATRLR